MLLDIIQVIILIVSLVAAIRWLVILRKWPITIAVIVALLANFAFYSAVSFDALPQCDHNLISAVRVLLMVLVLAALPSTLEDRVL